MMPEHKDAYLGDWRTERAATQSDLAAAGLTPTEECEWKPIAIRVSAQDIGRMYAEKYSPYMFNQALLERFKAVGVPVEGALHLRLVDGAIAREKPNGPQDYFQYVWLPSLYVAGMQKYARENGLVA